MARHMDAVCDQSEDTRIVREIVSQLAKRGLRARPFSYTRVFSAAFPCVTFDVTEADLRQVATAEVRRSLDRVSLSLRHKGRLLLSHTPLDAQRGEVARLRQIARDLDPYADVPDIRAAVKWLDDIGRQEPPPGTDTGRWVCADEAYYLVDALCTARPTRYREGPFIQTAVRLHEARIGETTADDMYRVCSAVRKIRRRLEPQTTGPCHPAVAFDEP